MPAYTSPILRLRLSALGEDLNSWGDPNLNNAFYRIEEALGSILTLTITGDRTLDAQNYQANEYRRGAHYLTAGGGLAAAFTITVPPVSFIYTVSNLTTFPATYKTASGVGAAIRPGMTSRVLCDGTDCRVVDPTLDQIKTAVGPVNLGGNRLTGGADGIAATDFITVQQAPAVVAPQVQLASDWAQKTSGSVDGASGYSARLWATSTTVLTGGFKGAFGYANDAGSSATAAGTSASNAASSAGAASTSATNAANSATNAGTSATNASNSATLAQQWATSTTVVSGGFKGAYGYAQDASASAAAAAQSAAGAAGVTSFNGRSGAVTSATNDYNFSQISGTASGAQLPLPTASALGGVKATAVTAGQYLTGISSSTGALTFAQVAYSQLSGLPTLGTAAAQNVGTTANSVVQLDASSRLPAVDASQLTNVIASPPSTASAVGTYAFMQGNVGAISFGSTVSGASLFPAGTSMISGQNGSNSGVAQAGTWRCMGHILDSNKSSLFIRIA